MAAPPILGIDFGTSNTAAAWVDDKGRVRVIAVKENVWLLPSVAWYSKGHVLVGHPARQQLIDDPKNTVAGMKRFLGRKWTSPFVHRYADNFAYELAETSTGGVGVRLHGEVKPLEDIAVDIIKRILELASASLGQPVKEATLTVPAHFGYGQRQALRAAAMRAGLRVKSLVHEPTAAAMYYARKKGNDGTVLIFDLGGGTFDATLMTIVGGVVKVQATGGDAFLGGTDFDARIVQALVRRFEDATGADIRSNTVAIQRVFVAAEAAKITLSKELEARVRIPCLTTAGERFLDLETTLTRKELEDLTATLVEKCLGICQEILERAKLQALEIDEIVFVGGQTRMPLIQKRLAEIFVANPAKHIHPDLGVVVGAALLAKGDHSLIDVVSMPFGVVLPGGVTKELIPANTAVPAVKKVILDERPPPGQPFILGVYEATDATGVDREHLGTVRIEPTWLAAHPGDLMLEAWIGEDLDLSLFMRVEDGERMPLHITRPVGVASGTQIMATLTATAPSPATPPPPPAPPEVKAKPPSTPPSVVEKPAVEKPAVEKPAAARPGSTPPSVLEKPAVEKPAAEKPLAAKPAKPASTPPTPAKPPDVKPTATPATGLQPTRPGEPAERAAPASVKPATTAASRATRPPAVASKPAEPPAPSTTSMSQVTHPGFRSLAAAEKGTLPLPPNSSPGEGSSPPLPQPPSPGGGPASHGGPASSAGAPASPAATVPDPGPTPAQLAAEALKDDDTTGNFDAAGDDATAPVPGDQVGAYRLTDLVGQGSMGRVYVAEHGKLGRKVALKVLRKRFSRDRAAVESSFAEARAVNQIRHENIVEVIDLFEAKDGHACYAMELLQGRSLAERLKADGPPPPAAVLAVAAQIASAMVAVHDASIIHHALRPESVFLTRRDGRDDFVKLLDFGVAKLGDTGQLGYESPEQHMGHTVDQRADIYSLGVVLYQMVTGSLPFPPALPKAMLYVQLTQVPARPSSIPGREHAVPAALEDLILQCLDKEPDKRPQTMREVKGRLEAIGEARTAVKNDALGEATLEELFFAPDDEVMEVAQLDETADALEEKTPQARAEAYSPPATLKLPAPMKKLPAPAPTPAASATAPIKMSQVTALDDTTRSEWDGNTDIVTRKAAKRSMAVFYVVGGALAAVVLILLALLLKR